MEHHVDHTQKRFLIGFVILAAGLALLLRNFGILDYELKRYILRWEVILIALGFVFIFSHDNKGPGIVPLFVGGAFYLSDFFDFHFNFWQLFLPALLILAGILILFRHRIDTSAHCEKKNILDNEDMIDEVNVFGGGDRNIVSQNFQGGRILAIFGGSNFNLIRAKMAPGKNYIEVLAIFGGMKLIVPEDWNVRINVVSIFGGFSDKHRIRPIESPENNDTELILKGFVLFGGGEIKSF
jgi:predicted membrane protein